MAEEPPAENSGRLTIDHYFRLADVSEPQISPEGDWIAYSVTRADLEEDESRSRVWMVKASGGATVAMTADDPSSSHPRWSPDGRYLAFLSARDEGETQVWSLYRGGGEAVQMTDLAQSVQSFEWSPGSSQMLLMLQDPTPEEIAAKEQGDDYEEKTAPPWVIDREQFKADYVGYLDRRRTHIHLLDIESAETRQLTSGDFDDSEATWSPDGNSIAFTSNRTKDPDSNYNTDIWTVAVSGDDPLIRVTNNPGADATPAWSPDGELIAHTTTVDVDLLFYATQHLAVSSAHGNSTRVLTADLDRWAISPRFSADGQQIWFLLEDSGEQNLARININGGEVERVIKGENTVAAFSPGKNDAVAVLLSRPKLPPEIFMWRDTELEQTTFTNRVVLDELKLGDLEEVRFSSKDGTVIEGFVIKPPGFEESKRYPVILDIHGGPQSQYDYGFISRRNSMPPMATWWFIPIRADRLGTDRNSAWRSGGTGAGRITMTSWPLSMMSLNVAGVIRNGWVSPGGPMAAC